MEEEALKINLENFGLKYFATVIKKKKIFLLIIIKKGELPILIRLNLYQIKEI